MFQQDDQEAVYIPPIMLTNFNTIMTHKWPYNEPMRRLTQRAVMED